MLSDPLRIAILTGTRAEWGLLSPLAKAMASAPDMEPMVIATNMHLIPRFGNTIEEIKGDGFTPIEVPTGDPDGSAESVTEAMARCLAGMGKVLSTLKPDIAVILGDRFEMLAAAEACLMCGIPIAHIAGGETTLGAIDDPIRHAITQMASLHFPQTDEYRARIISMGRPADTVVTAGALGVFNALNEPVMSREELARSIGLSLERPTLLVTFHAATADPGSPTQQFQALLDALDRFPGTDVILTYPNNDPRGDSLTDMLLGWAEANPSRVRAFPSLGKRRYLSALRYVSAVVGNSSSGILEVPSAGIPTVDIGSRQGGRIAGPSVLHCVPEADAIETTIRKALSPKHIAVCALRENPYFRPDPVSTIMDTLRSYGRHLRG